MEYTEGGDVLCEKQKGVFVGGKGGCPEMGNRRDRVYARPGGNLNI